MNEKTNQKIDWIYLPQDVDEISLWGCLHDGELISCRSNLQDRVVHLEFSVKHLVEDSVDKTKFLLNIENATSVRANGLFRRCGEFQEPEKASNEERAQLIKAYQEKWREESLSWPEFESILSTDPLQIMDASMVSKNGEVTLRLGGFLNGEKFDDLYFNVFLSGKEISAVRSDGEEFSLHAFIELGKNYWKVLE